MCRGGHERSAALSRTSSRLLLVSRSAAISVRRPRRPLSQSVGEWVPLSAYSREVEVVAVMSSVIATMRQETVRDGLESGCRMKKVGLCVELSACIFFLRNK